MNGGMNGGMTGDDGAWFAPKRFGLGAGLPIAWQGWALIGGYLALLAGLQHLLRREHPAGFVAVTIILTLLLVVLTAQHTRGGWRWRWGED